MELGVIKSLLESGIANATVEVQGEGSHFDILVISEAFAGLRAVKKQQMVYAIINDKIADGSMHAVNMRLFTPAEWAVKQG
jgi:acid stress-induced BolA-like protein IbaG/YrbA